MAKKKSEKARVLVSIANEAGAYLPIKEIELDAAEVPLLLKALEEHSFEPDPQDGAEDSQEPLAG